MQAVAARARAWRAATTRSASPPAPACGPAAARGCCSTARRSPAAADGATAVDRSSPPPPHEVAPLVALAYGLTERECQVVRLCMEGRRPSKWPAPSGSPPYTVQDHLKSIFDKTGVRTRGELVGQVFLEHYVPRWERRPDPAERWEIR